MLFAPWYSATVFCLMAASTIGVGSVVGRALKLRAVGGERLIWEAAVGFVAATLALAGAGLCGTLDARTIIAATLLTAVVGAVRIFGFMRKRRTAFPADDLAAHRNAPSSANPPSSANLPFWATRLLAVAALAAVTASFVASLAPPTAGDALCYHLDLPKRFLQEGRIDFRVDDDNITYPLVAEMGFLWALAFDAPAAAATTQWAMGLLLAGAAYLLAVPYCGPSWSRLAACLVLLTPGVNNQMTAPLNDLALAAFCALSLAAWDTARKQPNRYAFALVGVMLGGAVGVKYNALLFGLSLAIAGALAAMNDAKRRSALLRGAVYTLVATLFVGGLWYGRAAWYRGDPLYPFFSPHATTPSGALAGFAETKAPLGRGPLAVVAAPWAMTMSPERFGGRAHQLGPLFLMFVPAAVAFGSTRALGGLGAATLLYFIGCVLLRQNVRFLLAAVPALALFTVFAWREMWKWPQLPRVAVGTVVVVVVLFQTAIPAARLRHSIAGIGGETATANYLADAEPTYLAAQWINDNLPPESHILSQEQRAFYIDPQVTRENLFRRRTHYDRRVPNPRELSSTLQLAGFTHLLTAEGRGSHGPAYDATLCRLVDAAVAEAGPNAPILLNQWRHRDDEGVERRYRLFALPTLRDPVTAYYNRALTTAR